MLHIHWFRQDLRLADNPALLAGVKQGSVLPIYILDDENPDPFKMGRASRWWLHHSLSALNNALQGQLLFFRGNPLSIFKMLAKTLDIKSIYWNRCYEPWAIKRDKAIKLHLKNTGITVKTFNSFLLWEPWDVLKKDGTPYRVFTPFYRRGCLDTTPPRRPLPSPDNTSFSTQNVKSLPLDDLDLCPPSATWCKKLVPHWVIGEKGAHDQLNRFVAEGLPNYKEGRNFPAKSATSRLSPHLHFGEISPHTVWHRIQQEPESPNTDHFFSELGWREFSYNLLFYNPDLPTKNIQSKFDHFPWQEEPETLKRWQKGQTGIPIVDAGMRELWQTGYMHNRIRMVVGSFLVKNLRIHWHEGERWFWDCLVDADLASNSVGWQWVAGCGVDAAPYFRIFNPVTQGEKFDPDGEYTRHFVPELKNLPLKYLFKPWEAPASILLTAGITPGTTYPHPLVDLQKSRKIALAEFQKI